MSAALMVKKSIWHYPILDSIETDILGSFGEYWKIFQTQSL